MEVTTKNEGGITANNTGVSIAAKMTNDEKIQAYIEKLEEENHDLQQKWLEEGFEKSKLVTENKRLNLIILGNEEEIVCLKDKLEKAKEIIRNLIRPLTEEEKHLTIDVRYFFKKRAEEFLNEKFEKTEQVR